MKTALVSVPLLILAISGTACATKGFVKDRVGDVNSKVDTLGKSVEETQERTRQNEGKISDVDQKAQAAQASASQAGQAANAADQKAQSANANALTAGGKADALDAASRRLVFEVVLNDAEGNFKFGQSELPDTAKAKLDELVAKLKADPKAVYFEIEGYTDDIGAKEINEKLGLARAEAVKKYLYTKHQIPLFKMNVISYGSENPVASNKTKEGRAQNRRVVIKILA